MLGMIGRRAVLVYPEFARGTFWGFDKSRDMYVARGEYGLPKAVLPPLGMMGLFNHLKPHYESVVLIDRNVDPRPLEDLVAGADHVYMGGMIAQINGMLKDAQSVKNTGKPLIVGGTAVDEHSPLMRFADHAVTNEAEMVLDQLLQGLHDGKAEKLYQGIATPPERFFVPDFSSINLNNYGSMAIQTTRGCPEACEFCDITARFGRAVRVTPAEKTRAALTQAYDLGWRGVFFLVDDNFIGSPERTVHILDDLWKIQEELGYHFGKYTELTLRLADKTEKMARIRAMMKRDNFTSVFIGVETDNPDSLRETGKIQNLRGEMTTAEKLTFIAQETGAAITMGIIHGFDNDRRETVPALADFINSTNAPMAMAGLLMALTHTQLEDRLRREGRLKDTSSANNSDGTINFVPYNFSARDAERDYVGLLKSIYAPKAYFSRVMRELSLIDPAIPDNVNATFKENAASLLKLMTRDHAGSYWKHLPQAHSIASERFGFGTPGYKYLMGRYFVRCGEFTHFADMVETTQRQVQERTYQPWQLHSWKELQESPLVDLEVVEPHESAATPSLYDKVRMELGNGYQFVGTRFDALSHFVEPYIKEGLRNLKERHAPSLDQLFKTELLAYVQAHTARPQILGNMGTKAVETHLSQALQKPGEYLAGMRHLFKSATVGMNIHDVHST